MRRIFRAAAPVAAFALLLAACGDDDGTDTGADTGTETTDPGDDGDADGDGDAGDDGEAAGDVSLIADGTLTVCSDVPYPPFEFEDPDAPSGYSGFDIDLVQEIADRNDLTLTVLEVGFDGIESGAALAARQCDLAASAMTITPGRAENLNFSDPYFEASQSLITLSDSGIESLEDVAGQSLGVQGNTTGAEFAEDNAPEGTEIIEFQGGPDVFTAIVAGQVVAGLQDLDINVEQVQNDDRFVIVETFDTGEEYGFAAATDNDALIDLVNSTLAEMRDDGTYDEIFDRYFGTD
jgi:polar amino acid transport system substrate-binding protein